MQHKKQLEIKFFQQDENKCLKDPVKFELTQLDNGSFCLSDLPSHFQLNYVLGDWIKIHTAMNDFNGSKKLLDEFVTANSIKDSLHLLGIDFAVPEENFSGIIPQSSSHIDASIISGSFNYNLES